MESFFGTLKTELVHHPNTPIAIPRGVNCSLISKAITIERGSTPPSATSPHNRQRQKPRNLVSTFPGEGHSGSAHEMETPANTRTARAVIELWGEPLTLGSRRYWSRTKRRSCEFHRKKYSLMSTLEGKTTLVVTTFAQLL
jgi:hypothetical protein